MNAPQGFAAAIAALCLIATARPAAIAPPEARHRREAHNATTSALLSNYKDSEDTIKETLRRVLNVSSSPAVLEPSTDNTSVGGLRLSLNITCQMKALRDTVEQAKTAVRSDCPATTDNVELSALQVVVEALHLESCEWMVKEARQNGSHLTTNTMCTNPPSDTVRTLCTHWDLLQLAEASTRDLESLVALL